MVKWCFLKMLVRRNKQLFTVSLSYETSSVTVKNGQYLTSRPWTGSAYINSQNTCAFINRKKSHTLFSIQQQRWYKKLLILWKARQLQCKMSQTLSWTPQKSETIWMNLVSLRLRPNKLTPKSNVKLNSILTNGFWSTKAPECMDCLSNISAWYSAQHPASYIQKIQCWLHMLFSVTSNQYRTTLKPSDIYGKLQ